MNSHATHLGQVQRRVADGEYHVNPTQVAEAILRRIGALTLDPEFTDPPVAGRNPQRPPDRRRAV